MGPGYDTLKSMRFQPLYVIVITTIFASILLSYALGVSFLVCVAAIFGIRFALISVTFGGNVNSTIKKVKS